MTTHGMTIQQQRDLINHAMILAITYTLSVIDPERAANDELARDKALEATQGIKDIIAAIPDDDELWEKQP